MNRTTLVTNLTTHEFDARDEALAQQVIDQVHTAGYDHPFTPKTNGKVMSFALFRLFHFDCLEFRLKREPTEDELDAVLLDAMPGFLLDEHGPELQVFPRYARKVDPKYTVRVLGQVSAFTGFLNTVDDTTDRRGEPCFTCGDPSDRMFDDDDSVRVCSRCCKPRKGF